MFDMRAILKDSTKIPAPESWHILVENSGVLTVWLVNDPRIDRSYVDHREHIIYVHDDYSYWENYKHISVGNAQSPEESVLLRFLHEVGHVVCSHAKYGGVRFNENGQILNDSTLALREKEAWDFAVEFKQKFNSQYNTLLHDYIKIKAAQ